MEGLGKGLLVGSAAGLAAYALGTSADNIIHMGNHIPFVTDLAYTLADFKLNQAPAYLGIASGCGFVSGLMHALYSVSSFSRQPRQPEMDPYLEREMLSDRRAKIRRIPTYVQAPSEQRSTRTA